MSKQETRSVAVRLPVSYRALLSRYAENAKKDVNSALIFLCEKGIKHPSFCARGIKHP